MIGTRIIARIFLGIWLLPWCTPFPLLSRGIDTSNPGTSQTFPKELSTPEQQTAYLALKEAEQLSQNYPKLRVFVSFLRPENLHKPQASHIWNEPSLYETFLWLDNFSLISHLPPADLQNLAQSLVQLLYSAGNLKNADTGELGRIFIKDYFHRAANNPYPGQGSWLVLRIFLDPVRQIDKTARRISILYNAYQEAESALRQEPPPPMQRSSSYPQKSNAHFSYQHAYLIPQPLLSSKTNSEETAAKQEQQETENKPQKPEQNIEEVVRYRLSFIEQVELYTQKILLPEYNTKKSLDILRNYLRDGEIDNDRLVPPALASLKRRILDTDSYFLIQEIILYYYLLYLPERCSYFITSQQNQLSNTRGPDLWRIQIPKIWAAIDAVRLRYSPELERLLPG